MTSPNQILSGKFIKAANGHVSYEIYDASAQIIEKISDILISEFGCSTPMPPKISVDQIVTVCRQADIELLMGWDNWSGFYIMATSPQGDRLVRKIGAYLDIVITDEEFEAYGL